MQNRKYNNFSFTFLRLRFCSASKLKKSKISDEAQKQLYDTFKFTTLT